MRAIPFVSVHPDWQLFDALIGGLICGSIGPFAQGVLDKALGFAVGLGLVWLCAEAIEMQPFAALAKARAL